MSQSPEAADAPADQVYRYQRGWQSVSHMIAEGRSFSGHERNCCFLNIGGGEFANVSALTELDFMDDSRAVAVVDWDFDGRLDLWVSNRTAPRIRFLRNDTRNDYHFVAVRLEGVTCNRDAIGARVELYLQDSPGRALVKQVSAGDGYLAQSSKWIHFGIASGRQIDRLVVHWPGERKETFRGVRPDRHYDLIQGSAVARQWMPPHAAQPNTPTHVTAPPQDALRRTVIVGKVPLPHAVYHDWQGNQVPLTSHLGRPLLVNLWSATCEPCLTELSAWTNQADRLHAAGLDVLALTVDSLLKPDNTQLVRARGALDKIGFRWSSGIAQPELVQTLEVMHHTYVLRKQDLPLPSSFLLDSQGRLAAIYKGPLPVAELLADVAILEVDSDTRRASAVPFPGRWASKPFLADAERIVQMLDKLGRTGDAVRYARRCIDELNGSVTPTSADARKLRIDLHGVLGEMLLKQGQREGAVAAFAQVLELGDNAVALHRDIGESYMAHNMPTEALHHLSAALRVEPDDAELLYNLAIAELAARKPEIAITHLKRAHELMPGDADVCFHLANALHGKGATVKALVYYRKALQLRPGWSFPTNNLAWILATHAEASLRDGREAVRLAEVLCQADDHSDPSSLATLAAAYAEVGRYDDAVHTNDRAVELAEARGQTTLARRLRDRAATFADRRPVRE